MYPSKPGDWPPNVWGTVLHYVSDGIDFFARLFGNNYGLAILIVTIIVRLIILPLFIRQLRYQRMMMELQPEIKKIRAKNKGDNQKIQQETMKLYQEAGTNPAAGCLPTVIQLPVLYALYGAIMGNYGLHHSTFLGIFPLGQHDPHYILPVVAGITTFVSSWLTMKNSPQQQRSILFIMPLFIIFIGARLPSGLVLYWVYTNLFTALQTYVFLSRPNAARAGGGNSTQNDKPKGTASSGKSVQKRDAGGSKKEIGSGNTSTNSSKSAKSGSSTAQKSSRKSGGSGKGTAKQTSSQKSGQVQKNESKDSTGLSSDNSNDNVNQTTKKDASGEHSSDGRSQ